MAHCASISGRRLQRALRGIDQIGVVAARDVGMRTQPALQIIASYLAKQRIQRISGYAVWDKDFPRTASMKVKRGVLAEEIRKELDRSAVIAL